MLANADAIEKIADRQAILNACERLLIVSRSMIDYAKIAGPNEADLTIEWGKLLLKSVIDIQDVTRKNA